MSFETIDVSELDPFVANQANTFRSGINVVKGTHGSGKSTMFSEMQRLYRESRLRHDLPVEIALGLVFVGEGSIDRRHVEGLVRKSRSLASVTCGHLLPTVMSHYLNRLIVPKIRKGPSKFGSADCSFPFRVEVSQAGEFDILDSTDGSAGDLFVAVGESVVLAIACNLALRDLFKLADPVVVDGVFDRLDPSLLDGCYRELAKCVDQSIFLIGDHLCDRFPVAAEHDLKPGADRQTTIVALHTD